MYFDVELIKLNSDIHLLNNIILKTFVGMEWVTSITMPISGILFKYNKICFSVFRPVSNFSLIFCQNLYNWRILLYHKKSTPSPVKRPSNGREDILLSRLFETDIRCYLTSWGLCWDITPTSCPYSNRSVQYYKSFI